MDTGNTWPCSRVEALKRALVRAWVVSPVVARPGEVFTGTTRQILCARCGHVIAAGSRLERLCPACLLQTAIARPAIPYRIVSRLGEGPRGSLYLAESSAAGHRLVSVKEVPVAAADAESLERIDRVLDRIAALRHDALLPYLDGAVTETGQLRLVTDYLVGVAIHVFIKRESPSMTTRARLLADACDAIAVVHRHGFTNGNLTGCDVLVGPRAGRPRARVRDVGLPEVLGLPPAPARDVVALGELCALVVSDAGPVPVALAEAIEALRCPEADTAACAERAARAFSEHPCP